MEKAGADYIHLDVMDGHFVPNITIGPDIVAAVRPFSRLPFEVHLMISDPLRYIDAFAKAGADIITFHIEADSDIDATIEQIRRCHVRPGLVVKPGTPVESVFPYLDSLYMVLIMTVEPGFGGQSFMTDMMPKITLLKEECRRRGLDVLVEVDGGVSEKTIGQAAAAGADICVSGTCVFKANDMAAAIRLLQQSDQ